MHRHNTEGQLCTVSSRDLLLPGRAQPDPGEQFLLVKLGLCVALLALFSILCSERLEFGPWHPLEYSLPCPHVWTLCWRKAGAELYLKTDSQWTKQSTFAVGP